MNRERSILQEEVTQDHQFTVVAKTEFNERRSVL
jgi:hypothetical protein